MNMSTDLFLGYQRVSKANLGGRGVSLESQTRWLTNEAERKGVSLEIMSEAEGTSGKRLTNRPVLLETLRRLDNGDAQGLFVQKLDRLARSTQGFLTVLERSRQNGWKLVVGDAVDMTSPMGVAMGTMLAVFGELEREMIRERTREALNFKRSQGMTFGRPSLLPPTVISEIYLRRSEGVSLSAIARDFNERNIKTANGGAQWWPSTIKSILSKVA